MAKPKTALKVIEAFKAHCNELGLYSGYVLAKALLDSVCEDLLLDSDRKTHPQFEEGTK